MSNGYKQYGVRHLVRLLHIRRLRDLGVPLSQIEAVGFGGESPATALSAIDADLAMSIERLQRARAEIHAILAGSSATDVPSGFEDVAIKMSDPTRSLALVYGQLYDDTAMTDLKRMIELEPEDVDTAFDALPADADDDTRQSVAEALAPVIAQQLLDYPWLSDQDAHQTKGSRVTRETFVETVTELYNKAQIDVLGRASLLAHAQLEARQSDSVLADPKRPSGQENDR